MPKITGKIKVQLLFFPLHNYRQQATQHDHNMWTWKKKKQEKQSTSFKTEIENDIYNLHKQSKSVQNIKTYILTYFEPK